MGKSKPDTRKKKKKSSQLVIRIEAAERDAFVKLCDQLDTSAAREIRRFMRDWVVRHMPPADLEVVREPAEPASPTPSAAPPGAEPSAEAGPDAKTKPARRKRLAPVEANP